ncbi:D-lyxose/D-mannose family sugar isomerase [Oceaniglobus trochenteri]|uniref:D-lyxose/D-mannose family sugar isomerase n=1 Tax=Oceaniglobus trochenteri TaxID=2763260 RepID=UPI001CFFCE36
MKRSQINEAIKRAEADFRSIGFALPAFARWDPELWAKGGDAVEQLIATGHGWDITDFNEGRFLEKGLLLFTMRNGHVEGGDGNRPYAEKIMISRKDQLTPMHTHHHKIEDIIHRAPLVEGATLAVKLYASDETGALSRDLPVRTYLDGIKTGFEPGHVLQLAPGQSITLFPGTFHAFWGHGGDVVIGEVSSVNDDKTDNIFAEPLARFSDIEEDAPIYRPLVNDHLRAPVLSCG